MDRGELLADQKGGDWGLNRLCCGFALAYARLRNHATAAGAPRAQESFSKISRRSSSALSGHHFACHQPLAGSQLDSAGNQGTSVRSGKEIQLPSKLRSTLAEDSAQLHGGGDGSRSE